MDDDDLDEPLGSSRQALEHADHGKQEKQEQKVKGGKQKELGKLKLQVLKQQLQAKDEGASAAGDQKPEQGMGTKTREEEIKRSIDDAETKPGPETMIRKEEQEEQVRQQAAYEQSKDQTA